MATTNDLQPEIIVIDQSDGNESDEYLKIPKHAKMLIHTGNVASWNSLKSRKNQMPANELYHTLQKTVHNWVDNLSEKESTNAYTGTETFESDEERTLIKITAKILLHKFEVSFLEEAVKTALKTLKIKNFDTLILSLPPVGEQKQPFQDIILPYWQEMEKLHSSGITKQLSSCDLDKEKLESLINIAKVKPEVNQVNLTSCCHMPQDLVHYAKSENIILQTHGDHPVMLPDEKLEEIMQLVETNNEMDWKANWIVRYVVLIRCRGVIQSKGYIAAIEGGSA